MRRWLLILGLVVVGSSSVLAQGESICPGVGEVVRVNGPGFATASAIRDDLAMTFDVMGFTTWDLRDPSNPSVLGSLEAGRGHSPYQPRNMGLYMHADGWAMTIPWFDIIDLRHPAHPELIEWEIAPWPSVFIVDGDDPWRGVAVSDRMIAASHNHGEIWLLDLSQGVPSAWLTPPWPGLPGFVSDLAFVDERLVVLGALGEIAVYDLSSLAAPTLVGSGQHTEMTPGWSLFGGSGRAVALRGVGHTWVGQPLDVVTVDLTDPTSPTTFDVTTEVGWYTARSVAMTGTGGVVLAVPWGVGATSYSLYEMEFGDPAHPVTVTTRSGIPGFSAAADSQRVLVPDSSRLNLYDRSIGFPLVGASPVEGDADDLDVSGDLGVLANGSTGLVIYDLTDPSSPVEQSRIDVGGWAQEVRISGSTAVVLVRGQSLTTVDFSDPTSPQILGSYPLSSWSSTTNHLAVDGDLALVTEGRYGYESSFLVIDISDPSLPVVDTGASIGPDARNDTAAHLSGTVVLTTYGGSLLTYDVSNHPPVLLDSLELAPYGEIYSTAVIGDTAFVATGYNLYAIDVSDPAALVLDETYDSWFVSLVGATGTELLAIASSDGTYLADFTDLTSPILHATPRQLRWWEPGRIVGDTWLRPSGPFLDIMSLECRAPEADFRWWGLGKQISFENLSRYPVADSSWDFGDGSGSTSLGISLSHIYDQPGRYFVTLDVTGPDGGADSISKIVEVGTRIFADDFETTDTIGWD